LGFRDKLDVIRKHLEITNANSIARRYFVMNSFDGIVTILGIITGAIFTNLKNPMTILGIGLSASIGLAISGISGTLIAEMGERELEIKRLEESMLSDLSNSLYEKAVRTAVIWVGLVDAVSPLLATIFALIPILLSSMSIIDIDLSLSMSMGICLLYLLVIGLFMGKMLKKNPLIEGGKLLGVGILTTIIISLVLKPY